MAFTYTTAIQNRIALDVFGVLYTSLTAAQKEHLDGTWTTGSLASGKAYDTLVQVQQIANYFEMAGGTSAPQVWEPWVIAQTAAELAPVYRPERVQSLMAAKESAIDQAIDTFTLRDPTGSFASTNDSQKITVQGIRYFCLNHGSRRKESGSNTGMRRRLFFPIDEIDSHTQWALNYIYNKELWSFRKRSVQVSIKYLSTVTGATWTESTKTLTQTGAFTNLLFTSSRPAMVLITDGTGATIGEYQVASKTSSDAIVLTASISTANANLATGDITAVMFFLDFRGLLANETFDAVASRRFYYQNTGGLMGSDRRLNWVDSTEMDAQKAYNSLAQGTPTTFRIENQPSDIRSWRLAPFPDNDYTLNGSVFVSGPGTPSSVSDTAVFDKFPTEFGPIIRDMVLARLLQANNASDGDRFMARMEEKVQTLLPELVDKGPPTRLHSTEDVYRDERRMIGGNLVWGGSGGLGYGCGGLT